LSDRHFRQASTVQVLDLSRAAELLHTLSTESTHARAWSPMTLESLLQYVGEYLSAEGHPDYPAALNGLQVGGPEDVQSIAAAVDASEASILAAADLGADLLIVHHGLFWGGLRPLTGRHLRRVRALIENEIALYSCHLPLDGHAEIGNSVLLARALGLDLDGRFAAYEGAEVGWHGRPDQPLDLAALVSRVETAVGGPVHAIAGGPARIDRVGVVTGGGASFTEAAARLGLDALVTGEAPHHAYFDAMEHGVHLLLGGHYATETFGVRALAEHLAERFDLTHSFIDQPTGL
jgi:dinuclear metal center YbgI/SA1388 family protein